MSNEITTTTSMNAAYPVAELRDLANAFVECGFYGFRKPAEALVLMLKARADGIDPMTAADQYSIIQGRPALKSEAILIRFQSTGGSIKWKKREDEVCTLWLSHPKGGELEVTWNKDRALKAGLWNKDNFKKHPAQMLAARCISEGVRALYPACLSGCYTPEESEFFEAARPASTQQAHVKQDPVQEAVDAYDKESKAKKANDRKAAAVEAEVVDNEQEVQAEAVNAMDQATAEFVRYMEDLRKSNAVAFDNAWGSYVARFGTDFSKVPAEEQRAVYTSMKKAISAVAAANIGEYL